MAKLVIEMCGHMPLSLISQLRLVKKEDSAENTSKF